MALTLDDIISRNLLGRQTKISSQFIKKFRILGIDEVGVSLPVGPIHVGFYIETCERVRIRDSKKLSVAKAEQLFNKLVGFKHVETIAPKEIDSFKRIRYLIREAIVRGLSHIPEDMYDLIVVDGRDGFALQEIINKPIVSLEQGDSRVYEVAAASIVAKHHNMLEYSKICEYYSDLCGVAVNNLTKPFLSETVKTYGPSPFYKKVFSDIYVRGELIRDILFDLSIVRRFILEHIFENGFISESAFRLNEPAVSLKYKKTLDKYTEKGIIQTYTGPVFTYKNTGVSVRLFVKFKNFDNYEKLCFRYKFGTNHVRSYGNRSRINRLAAKDFGSTD